MSPDADLVKRFTSPGEWLSREHPIHRRKEQPLKLGAGSDRVEVLVSEKQRDVQEAVDDRQAERLDGSIGEGLSLGAFGVGQVRLRLASADQRHHLRHLAGYVVMDANVPLLGGA